MTDETDTRARLLGELLAECDEPCPACGYNLRGLTGEACPECGEVLRLRVGMVEPRMGLYLAGLIGLACGVGFDATVLGYYIYEWARGWAAGIDYPALLILGLSVCGGAMLAWLRARGWIGRRSPPVRGLLVAGCWLLAAGAGVVFFGTVS